jgi:hypothetical protein
MAHRHCGPRLFLSGAVRRRATASPDLAGRAHAQNATLALSRATVCLYRGPRPQFISAADATFMNDDDRVIGLMSGKAAKAYSAGILSQHGLVEDRSPKGPIAITW